VVSALYAVCGDGEGYVRASLLPGAVFRYLDHGVCGRLGDEAVGEEE